jgi:hypothetical protein
MDPRDMAQVAETGKDQKCLVVVGFEVGFEKEVRPKVLAWLDLIGT